MKKRVTFRWVLCGLAAVLAAGSNTNAGVVAISRESGIDLQGNANEESYSDQESSNQLGTFDQGLSFDLGDPAATHSRGSVSQETVVDVSSAGLLKASGDLYAEAFAQFALGDTGGPLNVSGGSNLTVVFDVLDESEPFTSAGTFTGGGPRGATGSVSLQEISDPSAIVDVFGDDNSMGDTFDRQGQLQPGRYRLFAVVAAGSSGSSPGDPMSFGEDTSLRLQFTVGSEAAAIPLPPAVWPGMALMVAMGTAALRQRRARA
jgi:hypothetical protein